ncbi:synaptobrevin homolog YKT6-like [Paramacrobiotus metropolitanus]|uniref:synaptobrevin homolog YKT6-like n=1 Tax=Paramacrobiotus metropolitanus TaxID=2943436 RepID=UPI002445A323|nr:synaptobrevin homolog YKT6-like [Paramacrobiotus metropolitanus]
MKLYSLCVLYKGPKARMLKAAYDLQSFGYFQRGSVQEFMTFTSELLVERTPVGSKARVKQEEYICTIYIRSDSLAGVLISDQEYPDRVGFTLLHKVLDDFSSSVPSSSWPSGSPASINFGGLDEALAKYQNPKEADALTKIQADLDDTKVILHNTIEAVLQRGEKLDDLVAKSEELSMSSKAFYTTARKTNACCKSW